MATDKREVELIIKANNLSSKTVAEVTASIDKMNASLDKQVAAAKRGDTSMSALKDSYKDLEDAGKALIGQEALIERFRKISAGLETTRVKAIAAKAAYEELKTQQTAQASVSEKQADKLYSLSKSSDNATKALDRQEKTLQSLSADLTKAGVDTAKLDAAQASLVNSANKVTSSLTKISDAQKDINKNGIKPQNLNPFEDNGRTTLSLLQRIRGEILAITAAYVGFQGAISGVNAVLDTARTNQQIQAKLLAANGNDAKAAGEEYQYLREQAERLGLFLPDLAKTYSSFAIAAKAANMNTKEMRFVFERVAEAGRVMHLNEDDIKGIFNAITQMVSKGKVQSEELRGQLGDRLPGAIQFAAKQYAGGVKEFVKQLEKGNVEATNGVLNLARGLDSAFKDQLEGTAKGLDAQENRFRNSLSDFRTLIANSGLTTVYVDLLKQLTVFFKSAEGQEFAVNLAAGFKSVAEVLIIVVNNATTLQHVLEGIVAIYFAKQLFNMSIAAAAFVKSLIAMNALLPIAAAEMTALQRATLLAQKAFFVLGAFIAGWEIGKILSDKFEVVRQLGISLVVGFDKLWIRLKYGAEIAFEEVKQMWSDDLADMVNFTTFFVRKTIELFGKTAEALGRQDIADRAKVALDKITVKHSEASKSRVAIFKKQMEQELKIADDVGQQMFEDASDAAKKAQAALDALKTSDGGRTEDPGTNPAAYTQDKEKALKAYAELLAEVEQVESQSFKKQKDDIETVTKGIETQYLALFRKIQASGVKGAAELTQRLRAAVDVLKTEAVEKYTKDQLDKVRQIQKQFAEIETKLGKGRDATLAERNNAIDDTYKSTYEKINELDDEHKSNLKEQLDLLVAQTKELEKQKFADDAIASSQKELKDLVKARDDKIKTTQDLVQASLLTEQEGRQKIKQTIDEAQPGIEAAADGARSIAESFRGIATDSSLEKAAANIDLATASANKFVTELYTAKQANNDLASGITGAISESTEGFAKAAKGAESWSDAIHGVGKAFQSFASNFLRKIAEMIIQQLILNALQKSGFGGAISSGVSAAVAHEGGVVGAGMGRSRSVSPGLFANAPKYHSGGVVGGLAGDEYAAILKKNEEVLKADDPRNIMNGGLNGGTQTPVVQDIKVINTIDSASFFSEGLATDQGTRALYNFIRANRAQLRTVLG